MANEEVSNIGVKLSLDASNFSAGLGTAQGKLNTFQQQAAKAASGATSSKAAAGTTPTTLKVAIEPAQLQAALKTAATGLQTVHVPIDVDSRAIAAMRTKITAGIGVIPVQLAASFPKTGPGSPQAIIGTVFSSMAGLSPQKGQILARQAIDQILPKRAMGGPVSQGRPVVVGEHRAEVFRPGASGFIERDVSEYRRRVAELAALEYQISQRQRNIQHALRGARTPMLPPGSSMPPALGSLPLREGYVRGFHATKPNRWGIGESDEVSRTAAQNLRQIREHGLRMKNAQGHLYGEPDMNWFSGQVGGRGDYNDMYAVEAHLPARWFGRSRRPSDPYTIGGPESNMAVGRDISRRRFASFNEPWMKHTRYMMEEVGRTQGTARPTPHTPGSIMREYGPTIRSMRQMNEQRRAQTPDNLPYEDETQGYDQFVAEMWRRRRNRHMGGGVHRCVGGAVHANAGCVHRGYGGEASSLFGGDPEVMEAAAVKHFGVTDDIREAGYLTPSGKFLDFSGRHQSEGYIRQGDRWAVKPKRYGSSDPFSDHWVGKDYLAGQRSIDHNEASEFLPGIDHIDSVERMKSMGFIRVWGTTATGQGGALHTVGAEMTRLPTSAQLSRLVGASREAEHAALDVYDPMGYRLPEGSFATQWPDDPVGGKRMGAFMRQAIEVIQKNDSAAQQLREEMALGAGFNPNLHRAGGGLAFHMGEYRRYSDMAAASPLSSFGGNMWYRGRRRAMLEEAKSRGWLDQSSFGAFRRSSERVLAVPGLASPGINDELAMRWSSSILDAISQTGPAGRGQEEAWVRALQKSQGGLPVGYGYGNFAKAAAVASGNIWPPPFGVSPKVGPFYHALRGREQDLVADSHHLLAGGFDPNGPASKVNKIVRQGQIVGTKPTAERAMMLEASRLVQGEYSGTFPTMSRWQAGIWGEHFPFSAKPQPIQNAYTNLIVPKGMRGQLPPGASMTPSGLFIPPPRAQGGPVVPHAGFLNEVTTALGDWSRDPYFALMAYQAAHQKHAALGARVIEERGGAGIFEGLKPARLMRRFTPMTGAGERAIPTRTMLSSIDQLRGQPIEHHMAFDPEDRMSLMSHAIGEPKTVDPDSYYHGVPLWASDEQAKRFMAGAPGHRWNNQTNRVERVATKMLDMRGLVGVHNHPDQGPIGKNIWRPSTGDIGSMMAGGERESWVVTPTHTSIMRMTPGGGSWLPPTPLSDLIGMMGHEGEEMGLGGMKPPLFGDEGDLDKFLNSRRVNLDPRIWNFFYARMAEKYGIEFEHYLHPQTHQGTQMHMGMAAGGRALSDIRTLAAYKRYVAQHRDEPLFTRWSPDITKDMQPGTVSTHQEGWRMPNGGFEKGISAMPASPGAADLLKKFRARRYGEPVRGDDLEGWDHGLSGSYDLGPSRKDYAYREDPLEGYRQRRLYLMRAQPVGRGFDSEPVLDPTSIEPVATIRRKVVDQAYREWIKKGNFTARLSALERFDSHRARGGRAWKEWPRSHRTTLGTPGDWSRSMPEWYQKLYSGHGPNEDYVGRRRLARDFAGPPMAMPSGMGGPQDWLDMMAGEYGWGNVGPYQGHITDEQWRGPEAGRPRVAIPGMQDEPEISNILRSMALARHQGKTIKHHATGGPAGRGIYIVNEQGDGSEGFVANQDAHLIPKFVMDRIPGARDGARTGMINKPANSIFAPEQDGIIIPKWAVPYVGALRHAADGDMATQGRYSGRLPGSTRFVSRAELAAAQAFTGGSLGGVGRAGLDVPTFQRQAQAAAINIAQATINSSGAVNAPAAQVSLPPTASEAFEAANPTPAGMVRIPTGTGRFAQGPAGQRAQMEQYQTGATPAQFEEAISGFPGQAISATLVGPSDPEIAASGRQRENAQRAAAREEEQAANRRLMQERSSVRMNLANMTAETTAWQQVMSGRTPRGSIAQLASLGAGRGEMYRTQRQQREQMREFGRTITAEGMGEKETASLEKYIELSADLMGARGEDAKAIRGQMQAIRGSGGALEHATKEFDKLAETSRKLAPTSGGIVKSLGAVILATSLYGMAMQAASGIIQPAVEGSTAALSSFGDQLLGFSAMGTKVTKGLGDQLNQAGGNLDKVFGDVGLQSRISSGYTKFLEDTLGGSVTAKAAATNQGQVSDLFRASLGVQNGNAATGLYGGYGGVLGTSFLGSQLGGGKGFMEQIAGDVSSFAGPRGGINPEDLGRGLLFVQNQQFRDYVGGKAKEQGNPLGGVLDLVGGAGDAIRNAGPLGGLAGLAIGAAFPKTETPTANRTGAWQNPALVGKGDADQTGLTKYLANLGEEAKRGATALGQVSKYSYQLANSQEELDAGTMAAAQSGDAYAVSMATNGVILKDATGKIVAGVDDFATVTKQMAKGATIPDMGTYIQSLTQQLRAGFEVASAQAAHQLEIGIPGQLGLQLAGQPFMQASAGVLPPGVSAADFAKAAGSAPGGIDIASTLADAQAMQDDLTKQGTEALKNLSDWIGSQPGMEGPYNVGGTPVPAAPGQMYSSPIGPTISGAPMGGPLVQGGQAYVGGQTFSSGKAAFDFFTGQMQDAGKAITEWQTKIVNTQTAQQWAQFSNNLRLSNRAYADALALAGRGGGGRGSNGEMGGLERQQTMLGFMLSQKQINFQTAMAGFQAPGLTSEERGARQAQAEAEARIAQKQLNIQERMFSVGAGRGVTDTGAGLKLLKSEQAAQTAIAAAQKAIAAQQMKLSQAQAKAQVIQQKAEGNFSTVLQTAATYAGQFGGAVQTAVKTIYGALGFTQTKSGNWVQTNPLPNTDDSLRNYPHKEGYLGRFAKGAVMTVGEAGPETVAILRNPRAMMMGGGGFGGGGGGPVSVNLYLTVQGDVSGDATIEKIVRAVEASFNRKAARLGMRGFVSATG